MAKSIFKIIKFEDVIPNPYRDLTFNPLRKDKLDALVNSINSTDFWEGVMVRPSPTKPGKFELVFGHHRVKAAEMTGLKEAGFLVRNDIDNGQMLLRMDQENRDIYRNDIRSVIESVQGVVNALASGDIADFEIDPKTNKSTIMYAPSFAPGVSRTESVPHPYTVLCIAKKLERSKPSNDHPNDEVVAAIGALYLMEVGEWTAKDLRNPDKPTEYKSILQMLVDTRKAKDIRNQKVLDRMEKSKRDEETRSLNLKMQAERQAEAKRIHAADLVNAKKLADATREGDLKEAAERARLRKEELARNEKRQRAFEEARARLDAQVEANKKQEAETRKLATSIYRCKEETLPARYKAKAYIDKVVNSWDNGDPFVEDTKAFIRDKDITQKERDLAWKFLGELQDRISMWRGKVATLPVVGKAELKEQRTREEARRNRGK